MQGKSQQVLVSALIFDARIGSLHLCAQTMGQMAPRCALIHNGSHSREMFGAGGCLFLGPKISAENFAFVLWVLV